MKTIFLGLASLCLLVLAATFATAYAPASWRLASFGGVAIHMLLGLLATMLLLFLHGFVVLNYFIATGKAVDEALAGHPAFAAYKKRTRKLKGRTFPFATMSALFVIVTSVLGGLAWSRGGHASHWILAWIALAFNLFAFAMEYRSIGLNMALLDEVRALVRERRAAAAAGATEASAVAAPTPPPAPAAGAPAAP